MYNDTVMKTTVPVEHTGMLTFHLVAIHSPRWVLFAAAVSIGQQ